MNSVTYFLCLSYTFSSQNFLLSKTELKMDIEEEIKKQHLAAGRGMDDMKNYF